MANSSHETTFEVVVDTNAFYTNDVSLIGAEGFSATWRECNTFGTVSLVVPEVVRGERLYQLFAVAEKSIENAHKNFETIGKVTGTRPHGIPTTDDIKRALEVRFDQWLTEHHGQVAPVPFGTIDWKRLVNDALWRTAPFVPPSSDEKDSEKGFRDCLILETLKDLARKDRKGKIAFISNDRVLRTAALACCNSGVLAAYEDLGGLSSYLKLVQERLSQEFIKEITALAPTIFFIPGQKETLFYKANVLAQIKERFILPHFVEMPITRTKVQIFNVEAERTQVLPTNFERRISKDVYRWTTPVRHIQLLKNIKPGTLLTGGFLEQLRITLVAAIWDAQVVPTGELKANLVDLELIEEQFSDAWGLKRKFGFTEQTDAAAAVSVAPAVTYGTTAAPMTVPAELPSFERYFEDISDPKKWFEPRSPEDPKP